MAEPKNDAQPIADKLTKPKRRWFQYRLKTLLWIVTLACVAAAGVTWWIRLPLRTWNEFSARVLANDIAGANALCDATTIQFIENDLEDPIAVAIPSPTGRRMVLMPCSSFQQIRQSMQEARIQRRTLMDLITGRLRVKCFLYSMEVRRYQMACLR